MGQWQEGRGSKNPKILPTSFKYRPQVQCIAENEVFWAVLLIPTLQEWCIPKAETKRRLGPIFCPTPSKYTITGDFELDVDSHVSGCWYIANQGIRKNMHCVTDYGSPVPRSAMCCKWCSACQNRLTKDSYLPIYLCSNLGKISASLYVCAQDDHTAPATDMCPCVWHLN